MDHPERRARLLEVREAERITQVLRVDLVADAEGERLTPSHDLLAEEKLKWSPAMLEPHFPDAVLIVEVRGAVDFRTRGIAAAGFPRIGGFIVEPRAHEHAVVFGEVVVDVHLQQVAFGGQRVLVQRPAVGVGVVLHGLGVYPSRSCVLKITRDVKVLDEGGLVGRRRCSGRRRSRRALVLSGADSGRRPIRIKATAAAVLTVRAEGGLIRNSPPSFATRLFICSSDFFFLCDRPWHLKAPRFRQTRPPALHQSGGFHLKR